jgi:hypothetical protein
MSAKTLVGTRTVPRSFVRSFTTFDHTARAASVDVTLAEIVWFVGR